MKKIAAVLLMAYTVMATGCWRTTVMDTKASKGATHDVGKAFVIDGLIGMGDDPVDAAAKCGDSGLAGVEFQHSFIDLLLTGITLGIYSPISLKIYCKDGGGAATQNVPAAPQPDQVAAN